MPLAKIVPAIKPDKEEAIVWPNLNLKLRSSLEIKSLVSCVINI